MISWRTALVLLAVGAALAGCKGEEQQSGGEQMSTGEPAPLPPDIGDPTPTVVFETNMGTIVMELDREAAPKSVSNFLEHVENEFYNGLTFHRVRPGFMIQAGGFTPELRQRQSPRPPVPNEANNGLKNLRGTVALARTPDPHSATSQFFINLVDNRALDFTSETPSGWGYAVFGKVTEGMDVVDVIAGVPTHQAGQHEAVPDEPVIIERAYVRPS